MILLLWNLLKTNKSLQYIGIAEESTVNFSNIFLFYLLTKVFNRDLESAGHKTASFLSTLDSFQHTVGI